MFLNTQARLTSSFRRKALQLVSKTKFLPQLHLGHHSLQCSIGTHSSTGTCLHSFSTESKTPKKKSKFIPRKSAVQLTEKARTFFKALLESNPEKAGVILNYDQSSTGEPRMVFSFDFVNKEGISGLDEGVSLELSKDGKPKSPEESMNDGLPKLYVHHNAFLKVLGATVDVNLETITPVLYDREGNVMDPNA